MINILERQFDRLAKKIKERFSSWAQRFGAYLKRLLFPLYLFPIKLITYTAYYLVKFLIKFIFTFIGLIFETIIFPFKSLKNFLKSVFILGISIYLLASVFVIADYLTNSSKQAKVKEYERQIDQLVYKLYGLTKKEIEVVENFAKEKGVN